VRKKKKKPPKKPDSARRKDKNCFSGLRMGKKTQAGRMPTTRGGSVFEKEKGPCREEGGVSEGEM